MLVSLKFTSGYAAELEGLKDRTFEFLVDKINVLYGPNGCGKTTILKMLAAYTGLDHSHKNYGGGGYCQWTRGGMVWLGWLGMVLLGMVCQLEGVINMIQ